MAPHLKAAESFAIKQFGDAATPFLELNRHVQSELMDYFPRHLQADAPTTPSQAMSGEAACEGPPGLGHGFNETQCNMVGCCNWVAGACWSAVGWEACTDNTPGATLDILCESVGPMCTTTSPLPADEACFSVSFRAFYCDVVCSQECKTLTTNNPEVSVNDDALDNTRLGSICEDDCMTDLIKGMVDMIEGISKCDEKSSPPDDAKEGPGPDPNELSKQITQVIGPLCVKSNDGDYCIQKMAALEKRINYTENMSSDTLSCESPEINALLSLDCCFGSFLTMEDGYTGGNEDKFAKFQYLLEKCGGSMLPCTTGAMQKTTVVKSSIVIAAVGLSEEMLQKSASLTGIKKTIAAGGHLFVCKLVV